jgi:hypothetical protein
LCSAAGAAASTGACRSTRGVRPQRGEPSSRFTSEALCDSVSAWDPLVIRSAAASIPSVTWPAMSA